ncbi:MAG: glycosyltransferase family 4 protein [Ignavibacterium sp.]
MKIVLLGLYNESTILSGPEKFSKLLFNNLNKKENEVLFIDYFFKFIRRSNLFIRLFGKETISESPKIIRLGIIQLFFYLLKYQPDIIHIVSAERFTISIFLYKFLLKGKIVITLHSILRFEIPNMKKELNSQSYFKDYLWEFLAIYFSDKLFFLSNQQIELANKYYKVSKGKILKIPNGVEDDFFNSQKSFNPSLQIDNLKIVFYNGMNNRIERGLQDLIHILNLITNVKFKLFIIGEEIQLSNVKFDYEFVHPMPKESAQDGLIKFLKDKDIFLKSIFFDTFPIMVLECMASGLIIVVSNAIGISEYIENEANGFVYDKNNPIELKLIIENIYNHKYNLNIISHNAVELAKQFKWEKIAKLYLEYYKEII